MARLPTYFISHGGGPWPWLANMRQMLASLEVSLARMPAEIGTTPKAILMVSGHWEEPDFAVMSAAKPGMIYDYGGFPPETYRIIYPAPGAPDVAARTAELLKAAPGKQLNEQQACGVFGALGVGGLGLGHALDGQGVGTKVAGRIDGQVQVFDLGVGALLPPVGNDLGAQFAGGGVRPQDAGVNVQESHGRCPFLPSLARHHRQGGRAGGGVGFQMLWL